MARILVADDNSNIQKMVGLALKDQGIDVVAVGNGEAAVRKISDVKPDLVLADVFMPVRNGYEVCQYVKEDSALSHIPVILLVGAFDPLDEQEAQRVGADGVLKKPFVPPDPLISMVKSALTRAGVLGANGAPAQEAPAVAIAPLTSSLPKPLAPLPDEPEEETIPAPVSTRPAPIEIDKGSQPLAFGSLLETPSADEEEAATYGAGSSRIERDWKSDEVEEEEDEEEVETKGSWRRSGGSDLEDEGTPAGQTDWREAAFADRIAATQKSVEPSYAPAPEIVTTAAVTESTVDALPSIGADWKTPSAAELEAILPPQPETITQAASTETESSFAQTSSVTLPAPILPIAPTEESAPAEQQEQVSVEQAPVAESPAEESKAPASESNSGAATENSPASQNATWMSVAPNPWDSVALKASQLAAAWDVPAAKTPEVAAIPAETKEEIRQEVTEVTEATQEQTTESAYSGASVEAETPAQPNVDDVVAKVIAKMNPETLQALTKELLKPVIESIVREELGKK